MPELSSLDFATLLPALRSGALSPTDVVQEVWARIEARGEDHVWTYLLPREAVLARARELEARERRDLPLYGLPFAVKDNIDVAGYPTTAGCLDWAYTPEASAPAVQRVLDAGAILIGKNNLDQFANGLVGIRCPRGYCRNALHPDYIPGGSSSGSAVCVAAGLVSFSLGTDTGGSGRVPAALNNIVGLKPTPGLVSSRGLFYANRSLDCVTVFALSSDDAFAVLRQMSGYDPADPYSRREAEEWDSRPIRCDTFHFGVPREADLEFFGDRLAEERFRASIGVLESIGGVCQRVPFAPFVEVGRMLFGGPWLAERWLATQTATGAGAQLHETTNTVLSAASRFSAADAFAAQHRLQALRRTCDQILGQVHVLVVPTTGTVFRVREVEADPISPNSKNGYYTYYANLLDLCAIAVPAGLREDGLPSGVSVLAPAFCDSLAYDIGARFHAAIGGTVGALSIGLSPAGLAAGAPSSSLLESAS